MDATARGKSDVAGVRTNWGREGGREGGRQFNFDSCEGLHPLPQPKINITATLEEQQDPGTARQLSRDNKTNSCKPRCPAAIFTFISLLLPSSLLSPPSFLCFSPSHPSPLALALSSLSFSSSYFSILTLLLSSIMDSLEISASWSGPRAPGASQAVLIPWTRGVIKAKIIWFWVTMSFLHPPHSPPWGVGPSSPVLCYPSCPTETCVWIQLANGLIGLDMVMSQSGCVSASICCLWSERGVGARLREREDRENTCACMCEGFSCVTFVQQSALHNSKHSKNI